MGAMQQLRRQRQAAGSWSAQDEEDYHIASMSCHKPLIALAELGVPYTLHKINLASGEQRKPEFLRINPAGKIPVLVDRDAGGEGGLVLTESGAILFYLAEKDPGRTLLPTDAAGKAEALSWVFYQSAHLAAHTGMLVTCLMFGMQHSKDAMQAAVEAVRSAFKHVDARLAQTGDWLVGGQFSIADIAFVSSVFFGSKLLGMDLKGEYPNLAGWLDRALARPAVNKGLNLPDPNPLLAGAGEQSSSQGGGNPVLEAAAGRLAKLGLHLGA